MKSMWGVASMALVAAMFAIACADEDLETGASSSAGAGVTLPRVAAGAPKTTRVAASRGLPTRDQVPIFYRVQVRDGDTVDSVAKTYGVRPECVVWNNEGVPRDGELVEGTLLAVPSIEGIIHHVRLGETLSEIAARYGVEPQAIIDFAANAISSPTGVPANATILVPGGRKP